MPIGDGSLLRALGKGVKEKFPIAGAVVETLGPAMIEAIQSGDPEKMELAAKREPEVVNNLNLEKPSESRTTVWGAGTVLLGISGIIAILKAAWETGDFNVGAFSIALGSVVTGVSVVRGRWATGLAPLRWPKLFMPWKWGK